MGKEIAFIGIDIDDKAYHVSGVSAEGVEIASFVVRGSANKLAKDLKKKFSGYELNVCYEASYTAFSQARVLKKRGIFCAVIAPTSIPKAPNDRVKNDRLDALRLAELWSKGSLSVVAIPTEEEESERAIVRSRSFIVGQISDLKRKILSICREFGLDYKGSVESAGSHWTKNHRKWLDQQVTQLGPELQEINFLLTFFLTQLEFQTGALKKIEARIEEISKKERYKKNVQSMLCFKGVQLTSAMSLLTELFNIDRFAHPRQ